MLSRLQSTNCASPQSPTFLVILSGELVNLSTLSFSGDNYTEFKGLAPEEAQTKLLQLIKDEVDQNKDGFLTEDEIRARFHVTTKEYRRKEVLETMKQHDEG